MAPQFKRPELFGFDKSHAQSFVQGKWISSPNNKTFEVDNPATGEIIGKVADVSVEETKKAISAANEAFKTYKNFTHVQRSQLLERWAELIMENKDDLVKMLTLENGKPLSQAEMEVTTCSGYLKWYAAEAVRTFGDVAPSSLQSQNFLISIKQPVGVSALITPWNFPAAMIARKGGAALAAGCTAIFLPAFRTPYVCLGLVRLAQEAGFPDGVLNVITSSDASAHGKELTTNPIVRKVSFTGSTNVGKILMGQSASTIKKVSMELGGNAPFIVFPDFPIDQAVESFCTIKFNSCGQVCVCPNRVYVHKNVYDEFVSKLTEKVKTIKVGDGFDSSSAVGPLISQDGCKKVSKHIEDAVSKGAKITVGGKEISSSKGYFFEPTVLSGVTQDMLVASEETFGPLASVFKFDDTEEVIEWANDSDVGLAGYVFTNNLSTMIHVAKELEVGLVGANIEMVDEPFISFGGIKQSGFGKEAGRLGVQEFMVVKEINLKTL
ncbi:Succinate-semialdehyde dehydrogenase [Schizosaccharomyces pombe]|uniref:Succinate-semialdehyde dehydrogenase [NADP(+)] 2 n=1 Tax=Schizosaccharomyces pombe (strain 972 / ATCC 24843) TaxID=284812 RepID=SSDH2_SCHPO|nr:putative succinate-semialdehyde dehydrogenase [Schizosaccharomyces pombe]Q9UTM8.1 RecName: Full=Putative succinate-semialdehyde dehydrogenase C139.05 [NADP(+)]; Short=SSDH [Schizosaccharomyces pombe 972h-]CAB59619.1 succinate-semialdehyde dehydrogenase (predicted) [Schizosaccharomyces pombe]|eukprot:NP_593172.1 putative succinate-semialdehyde dehydrogenase [Schizosaccharomyces pombe]